MGRGVTGVELTHFCLISVTRFTQTYLTGGCVSYTQLPLEQKVETSSEYLSEFLEVGVLKVSRCLERRHQPLTDIDLR